MNRANLNAALQLVISESAPYNIKISQAELQVVTQSSPWIQTDKVLVRNALQAILNAGVDIMGLQRFQLPTEYVAAVIVAAVHPGNWKIASIYLSNGNMTELDVKAGYAEERVIMNPDRLFSTVLLAAAEADIIGYNVEKAFKEALEVEVEAPNAA